MYLLLLQFTYNITVDENFFIISYQLMVNQHIRMLDFTSIKSRKPLQRFPKGKILKPKLGKNLTEYLLNTSLHGLRYIGDVSLSFFER